RADTLQWYRTEMAQLDNAAKGTQMHEIELDQNGQLALAPPGPGKAVVPKMKPVSYPAFAPRKNPGDKLEAKPKPLPCQAELEKEEKTLFEEGSPADDLKEGLLVARKRLRKGVEDDLDQTKLMLGEKGYHYRTKNELEKREGVLV